MQVQLLGESRTTANSVLCGFIPILDILTPDFETLFLADLHDQTLANTILGVTLAGTDSHQSPRDNYWVTHYIYKTTTMQCQNVAVSNAPRRAIKLSLYP